MNRHIDADKLIKEANQDEEMSDFISRQAAIDTVKGEFFGALTPEERACAIRDIPSAQPEQQWIPFSEWLPKSGRYLVSCPLSVFPTVVLNYTDDDGEWFDDGCKSMDMEIPTINALMPLPKPYKGEES